MLKRILLIVITLTLILNAGKLKKAPNFKLENTNGKTVTLDSLTVDGPALINFWASWCKPCKEELPEFNKLNKKFSDSGLNVVLITIDKASQVNKAKNYLVTKGFELELLKDCNKKIFKNFGGGNSVPVTFLINQKKEVVYKKKGQINYHTLLKEIKKIIKPKVKAEKK